MLTIFANVERHSQHYAMYMRDNVNNKWLEDETNAKHDRLYHRKQYLFAYASVLAMAKYPWTKHLERSHGYSKANEVIRKIKIINSGQLKESSLWSNDEHIALNMHYQLSAIKER